MSEIRIEDVPERWRTWYEVARDKVHFKTDYDAIKTLIEEIARLTAQLKAATCNSDYFQQRIFDALGGSTGKPPWEKVADLRATSSHQGEIPLTEDEKEWLNKQTHYAMGDTWERLFPLIDTVLARRIKEKESK